MENKSNQKSEIILSEKDVEPASAKDRSSFITAASIATQVTLNSAQRQILGNLRLGVNNGENTNELLNRFKKNPLMILSGLPHRFTLQALTQGLPMYYNRVSSKEGETKKISESLTALWMTTAGCFFEVSGFKQPVLDKAKESGIDLNFWKKAPQVAVCITPLVLLRNNIYAQAVFGQNKNDPLEKKIMTAGIAGILTNPVDSAINIMAYETSIAKDGTPLTEIYRNTWNHFIASELKGSSPYLRFTKVVANTLNGATLRVLGVGGASLIFSKQASDALEEGFSKYMEGISGLWNIFQNNVADRGGAENREEKKLPSSSIQPFESKVLAKPLADKQNANNNVKR
ncbi:MAG: hypothetical protein EBS06_06655 [Proteobacteria bacterium]|nr:hypothetical protein [Pseudomonadota bacterium]